MIPVARLYRTGPLQWLVLALTAAPQAAAVAIKTMNETELLAARKEAQKAAIAARKVVADEAFRQHKLALRTKDEEGIQASAHFAALLRNESGKEHRVNGNSPHGNGSAPHPLVWRPWNGILGYTFSETFERHAGGSLVGSGVGTHVTSITWGSPSHVVTATSMQVQYQDASGESAYRNATWVAWNNPIADVVERYMVLTELTADGTPLGPPRCTHYSDKNPEGYFDPILLMVDRYNLMQSNASQAVYEYHLGQQTAYMTTATSGGPPQRVVLEATSTGADYEFQYFNRTHQIDHRMFHAHHGLNCSEVSNFSAPDVCFDSWLALQYECN